MNTEEAVLWAFEWLLREHRADLLSSEQANFGMLPRTGHGDDIWLRTERIHAVAEVTLSGAGSRWSDVVGPKRQNIVAKIDKLRQREGVTHKYLFVAESISTSLQSRNDIDDLRVIGIPEQGTPNQLLQQTGGA